MATLALAAVGAAVGGALLPEGIAILGTTLTGAAIGSQVGALAGSFVDGALFGASGRNVQGPRLSDLHVTASTEGAVIRRVYGRIRIGGQIIWATDFEEEAVTTDAGGGGKGSSGGSSATTKTTYQYYASFAVGLCEGQISGLGRVWANGKEIDLTQITYRLYTGSPTQPPDSLIQANLGPGNTPAFRDTAYIVFERLLLTPFGHRLPQLSFEVYRGVEPFTSEVKGVVVIPGSGEFVYATSPVTLTTGYGTSAAENVHTRQGPTDWSVSMEQLTNTLPNAKAVSLIVSWFGSDLRAGQCQLTPAVERRDKETSPDTWSVAGLDRSVATIVSQSNGRPAYGGTPSDATVIAAIRDLQARGHSVTLTPFILMDIPAGNTLPDPYGGAAQAVYPWRGRITVSLAPGQTGSPDKTIAGSAEIAAFVGSASPANYSLSGDTVVYTGPAEWSLRRMVLHHAMLAQAAGGVDAFLIGSELRGLTTARSGPASYPFVSALTALAADVKSILGPTTKVTYAADWSEYFGHHPNDGTGDVFFHLDPLWASPAIDAIAVDVYWPLSDWRDGRDHLDYVSGTRQITDLAYLKANVAGGEGFDWYYASQAARDAQVRTPITDGAGKPWVFRYKDIRSWWSNAHFNRPSGIESSTPTPWVPQSKPFWFTEVGCGAVDKASNEPNVFVDPKSSETALPYYSRGTRDDLIQRRYLKALIETFDPALPGYIVGTNPVSSLTGALMVDPARIHLYCWDARPFPAFPNNTAQWGDGPNWRLGHWLNGRLAAIPLAELVAAILSENGFAAFDCASLPGVVDGYQVDRIMSAREALSPFLSAFFVDAVESGGAIVFRPRGVTPAILALSSGELVETKPDSPLLTLTRAQESELPAAAKVRYLSGANDYRQAVAESRRLTGASGRISQADVAVVMDADRATAMAESWLFEAWASREKASFSLPPSTLALEPSDIVAVMVGPDTRLFRLTETGEHNVRDMQAVSIDPDVYGATPAPIRSGTPGTAALTGQPLVLLIDLPLLRGDEPPYAGYAAAVQTPWPGGVAIYSSPETSGYQLKAIAARPATIGLTLAATTAGPAGRWDNASTLSVSLSSGTLASVSVLQLLAGSNAAAVRTQTGDWEVIQFLTATLTAPSTYQLSGLLRGQAGTDAAIASLIPAGAPFVLLDAALAVIDLTPAQTGLATYWRSGPSSRGIGDATYATQVHAFAALGLRPLSPVRLKSSRAANGDLSLNWIRRTRIGGDSWDLPDVPLSEASESYQVQILSGPAVVRTFTTAAPALTYLATDQATDFGTIPAHVSLRIAQVSQAYGPGAALNATV